MKTINFFSVTVLFLSLMACSSDDDSSAPALEVESETVSNLHAPQQGGQGQPVSGAYTKFDFASGQTTTSDTDWDIAFRGTSIVVNGGVSMGTTDEPERTGDAAIYIAHNATLASVQEVDTSLLIQDTSNGFAITGGSGNGWYNYTGAPNHLIVPIAGKILVVRTHTGNYAKFEILSYYENAPQNPNAFEDADAHYTFNYVYQPNDGVTSF